MVTLENNTEECLFIYVRKPDTAPRLCILGNVDDRGRQIPVTDEHGRVLPGQTVRIADSRLQAPDEWVKRTQGGQRQPVLPSPVAVFTEAEWKEVEAHSPEWPLIEAALQRQEFTKR